MGKTGLAALMVFAGVAHFAVPRWFEKIVPLVLPWKRAIVYISGAAEVGLGVGLLVGPLQRWAAWGLVALFIAVFPANVSQALRKIPFFGAPLWLTWVRLPLQAGLIAWAYAYT